MIFLNSTTWISEFPNEPKTVATRINYMTLMVPVYLWSFDPLTGQIKASGSIYLGSEIYKCEKNWWKIYHSLIYLHNNKLVDNKSSLTLLMSYSQLNFSIFLKRFKKFVRFYFGANSLDPSLVDGSGAIGALSYVGSVGCCRLLWPCCMSFGMEAFHFSWSAVYHHFVCCP